ncbi:hypothetical protein CO173_01110 [Candidatus Uhrbacteria bacterium CG_4_9_14_3_um_filter_41_35]|uniref:ParB-like N-terminal domain-containing protein n=1 Tax=Candidatus Uhrbacteria bacterium CG_4_9_14_3_um_filter_41_35 TaxID=1975034 RepID=A0A2M7XG06_9BACT|nr:MAG: hypothetical protein COV92_03850 [Candidatus Uhrbacteria bacterium CG11_big_fil_rev_8_21_14_0_20_41_9]PJA46807.1 MAG: hypothetical protein CO173_01110 [Candidatus Uhrbacteria bacterium CG_4_9_14_3_um_filter_41_35]
MTKPQGGLGRGLGALIPQKIAPEPNTEADVIVKSSGITEIDPALIVANPHQPRSYFSPSSLEDLLGSIKEHGIMQPLTVTEVGDGRYELIAGERRLRASKMLGLSAVPVIVRTATDQQKLELALIENIQRQDLNTVEEARAYKSLADLFSLTQQEVAERVGKSRSAVANTIRLLELDDEMLDALQKEDISKSQAKTLLGEDNLRKRHELFNQMLSGELTVKEAEERVRSTSKRAKASNEKDPNILALEDELRSSLGTKVKIDMSGGNGKISVYFYSRDELKEIIKKLT